MQLICLHKVLFHSAEALSGPHQVPCKQRLVVLAALLRKFCQPGRPAKLVVFFSCCDAVEYLHRLFDEVFQSIEGERLVSCPLYKLHGNLPQVLLSRPLPIPACSFSGT